MNNNNKFGILFFVCSWTITIHSSSSEQTEPKKSVSDSAKFSLKIDRSETMSPAIPIISPRESDAFKSKLSSSGRSQEKSFQQIIQELKPEDRPFRQRLASDASEKCVTFVLPTTREGDEKEEETELQFAMDDDPSCA